MSKIIVDGEKITLVQRDEEGNPVNVVVPVLDVEKIMRDRRCTIAAQEKDPFVSRFKPWKWVKAKFIKANDLRAESYVRPTGPVNCPVCNSRIEQKPGSAEYVCIGLANREEIENYLPLGDIPKNVTKISPCGWHARADEFGKTWA